MSKALYFLRVTTYPAAFIILGVRANSAKDLTPVLPMAIAIAVLAMATITLAILNAVLLTAKVTALTDKINIHGVDLVEGDTFTSDALSFLGYAVLVSMLVLSSVATAPITAAFWCAAAITAKVTAISYINNTGI